MLIILCVIDDHDVQRARFVLQRAADYHGRLLQLSQTPRQDEADECIHLESEWTAMRIMLVSLSRHHLQSMLTHDVLGLAGQPTRNRRAHIYKGKRPIEESQARFRREDCR